MKKFYFIPVLLCFFAACTSLSDKQKAKITAEVKAVNDSVMKAASEVNIDKLMSYCSDSPDFWYMYRGLVSNYNELKTNAKAEFELLKSQEFKVLDEKYIVTDGNTVVCKVQNTATQYGKDGHVDFCDPWAIQTTYHKINGKWLAINVVESGVYHRVKVADVKPALDQVALMAKFLGKWKVEGGKDTVCIFEQKPFGDCQEVNGQVLVKGKPVNVLKQFFYYDKASDRYMVSWITKGTVWFTPSMVSTKFDTPDEYTYVFMDDMNNPDLATTYVKGKFVSPVEYTETTYVKGKEMGKATFKKIY